MSYLIGPTRLIRVVRIYMFTVCTSKRGYKIWRQVISPGFVVITVIIGPQLGDVTTIYSTFLNLLLVFYPVKVVTNETNINKFYQMSYKLELFNFLVVEKHYSQ